MDEFKKINADIEAEKEKTQLKKEQFIKQIKNGLGDYIKVNGGKINKIKKSKLRKFWERLMDVF
jgi:RNase P/RNase MRP subunit p29